MRWLWCRMSGREGRENPMDPTALAMLAAQTVVAAASTDAWGMAKRGIARLLGRGDPQREQLVEQRLDQTQEQLRAVPGQDLELARADLEAAWRTRLVDLMEEHPDAAADLQALVEQIRAELPAAIAVAADHSVAAGRDMNITASGGGVAAGSIHGDVSPGNPPGPDPAQG
jgi:hypothetical protein